MLDMGFLPQMERCRHGLKWPTRYGELRVLTVACSSVLPRRRIINLLPPKTARQTLMFSATFAKDVQAVAESFLRGPEHTAHVYRTLRSNAYNTA